MLNVLYHDWIASEAEVLAELRRVLKAGGLAVITEPAFAALAREMDVVAMGRRRYRIAKLRRLCRSAGLEVVVASYFTSFGAALLLAIKAAASLAASFRGRRRAISPDMKPVHPVANEILYRAALIEAQLIRRGVAVPMGTTLVCLVRKPVCRT
jgi:hypothetical protein